MTVSILYDGTKIVKGLDNTTDYHLLVTQQPTAYGDFEGQVTILDAVVDSISGASIDNDFSISVENAPGATIINETPEICSLTNGIVSRVSDGTAILSSSYKGVTRKHQQKIRRLGGDGYDTFSHFANNSLAKHIEDYVAAAILGRTGTASDKLLFTTEGGTILAPTYTRNPNLYIGSMDLTAITTMTDHYDSGIYPAVLITPQHVMMGHVGLLASGGRLWFKDSTGADIPRTILAQRQVINPYNATRASDDQLVDHVGILNEPITTITPMKMMPANWLSYLPAFSGSVGVPVLNKGWTAGRFVRILMVKYTRLEILNLYQAPITSPYYNWSSAIIGGDSNGPVWAPINGEPVLLHCMNKIYGGAMYPSIIDEINTYIDSLGRNGYNLTYPVLTGFTEF